MKKRRKKRDYYTLDGELLDNFLEHIEENNLNKSKLIETLIQEYMNRIGEGTKKDNGLLSPGAGKQK
jgi:hypothetical protein